MDAVEIVYDPSELTVDSFFSRPFSLRRHKEKLEIVRRQPPRPLLSSLTSKHKERVGHKDTDKEYVLNFQSHHYDRVPWLAGSEERNKLYCWPCLLFSVERSVWTSEGYGHLKGLTVALQKHDRSQNHVSSVVAYKSFGVASTDRPNQLFEEESLRVQRHNAKVRRNRELLLRMIDVVCVLPGQERLPLLRRCVDGNQAPPNKVNYVETLKLISDYVPLLKAELEDGSSDFRETITDVEDDLIRSVANVLIRSDVNVAKYISIVLDETSDSTTGKTQLCTVLRYVTADGETCERLVDVTDIGDNSADALYDHVMRIVDEFGIRAKLIGHGYGAMSAAIDLLCTKIQENFPKAPFFHSHGHQLNQVLQQSMYHVDKCKEFFRNLNGLASFFVDSPKRITRLSKLMLKRNKSHISAGRWRFTSRLVNTVHQNRHDLVEYFEEVLDDCSDPVDDDVTKARYFLAYLTSFDVCFQLIVFSLVFDHTDALCNVLQTKSLDVECCVKKVNETLAAIKSDRERYYVVWSQVLRDTTENEPPRKTQRNNENSLEEAYRSFYHEIIDIVTTQIEHRFGSLENQIFVGLVNPEMFIFHSKKFPEDLFTNLLQTRNNVFDFSRLKNELIILYRLFQFRGKSPCEVVYYLRDRGLRESMPELYRLCVFVLTIPSTRATVEPTFSAVKRLRRHTRAAQTNRLTDSSLLSIENVFLKKLRNKAGFYEDVTNDFTQQKTNSHTDEFIFK